MEKKDTLRVTICGNDKSGRDKLRKAVLATSHEVVDEFSIDSDDPQIVCRNNPDIVLVLCESSEWAYEVAQRVHGTCPTPVAIFSEKESEEGERKARLCGASFFHVNLEDTTKIDQAVNIAMVRHPDLLELMEMRGWEKRLQRESIHKFKNNLATITSIMYLQADSCTNSVAAEALLDCANRVRVISTIHDVVSAPENADFVDLGTFIGLIVNRLRQGDIESTSIALHVDADKIMTDRESAISCGLIINELVTNALKHAFPAQEDTKEIRVTMKMSPDSGLLELSVGDNGVGLPEAIVPSSAKSFGYTLVSALLDQLQGVLEVDRTHGAIFKITCKIPVYSGC